MDKFHINEHHIIAGLSAVVLILSCIVIGKTLSKKSAEHFALNPQYSEGQLNWDNGYATINGYK